MSPVELAGGRGIGGGGGVVKSYDGEKTWSSINHSILSPFTLAYSRRTFLRKPCRVTKTNLIQFLASLRKSDLTGC